MTAQNIYPLSLNGDTFNGLKADFDMLLRQLLTEMERREEEEATITIKVGVKLEKDRDRDFEANYSDAMRDILKPSFKHDISTVMQIKSKRTGSLGGSMEMVWDRELCQYVMRPIDNGQTNLFDSGSDGKIVDDDYTVVEDTPFPTFPATGAALPAPENASRKREAFEWLRQFVGVPMKVLESMGNCTVRTTSNQVILTSADPNFTLYCPAEVLMPHVGHSIVCVGSPSDEDKYDNISIWCEDCEEVLFSIDLGDEIEEYGYSEPDEEEKRHE